MFQCLFVAVDHLTQSFILPSERVNLFCHFLILSSNFLLAFDLSFLSEGGSNIALPVAAVDQIVGLSDLILQFLDHILILSNFLIFVVDGSIIFLDKFINLIFVHFLSLLHLLFNFVLHFFLGDCVLLLVALFEDGFEMGVLLLDCVFFLEELVVFGFYVLLFFVELLVGCYQVLELVVFVLELSVEVAHFVFFCFFKAE